MMYPQKFDRTVYTFGFGADHDAGILTAIAMQGGGAYYSISTSEKVKPAKNDYLYMYAIHTRSYKRVLLLHNT